MASVYSAYDTHLERIVAVKMLRAELEIEEVRARMLREAQAMARLKHENVVTVYEVGTFENRIYIAMEYVDGKTLNAWSKETRPWRDVLRVLKAAGRGLAAAHEARLVHRDFKPDNVLVGKDGRVLVSDFGIALSEPRTDVTSDETLLAQETPETGVRARVSRRGGTITILATSIGADDREDAPSTTGPSLSASDTERLTQAGAVLGTPGYMAPEHLFTGVDDARSDQFSFCVSMYRALYGKRPFEFQNLSTYRVAVQRPPEPPPSSTPVPSWVHAVILRGLQQDPTRRFASMNDLLDALEQDPSRRYRKVAAAAAVVAACAAGLFAYGKHRAELLRQCSEGDALMAATWNADRSRALRAAFEQSGIQHAPDAADRAIRTIDQYAQTWKTTHRTVAEATLLQRRQEVGVMTRRLRCLERGRERLGAVLDLLAGADAVVVQHALDAIYELPVSESCATTDLANLPALPPQHELRARVLASERTVAQAQALVDFGNLTKAEELTKLGIAEARAIPYARTEAELLLIDGSSKQRRGETKVAIDSFLEAFGAGERAADDALAGRAAVWMSRLCATWMRKTDEAERWNFVAQSLATRVGHDDALQVEILIARTLINSWAGRTHENVDLHDKIIELTRRRYGDRDLRFARALEARSLTYELAGQSERSIQDLRAAIDIVVALTGADNRALAKDYANLGASLTTLRRFAEAKAAYEHAFTLQTEKPSQRLFDIYEGLAEVDVELGEPDVALAVIEKGLGVAQALELDGTREWPLRAIRAAALARKGDINGKAAECSRILADQELRGKVTSTETYYPDALTCLGEAELALHQTKSAIAHLERSVSLTKRLLAYELPKARFALAKALRVAGREPERARELAESARKDLSSAQGSESDVADVDEWLGRGVR